MTHPLDDAHVTGKALELVAEAAVPYLDSLATRPVNEPGSEALLGGLGGPLPERGDGTVDSVARLLRIGTSAATHSAGPRFFHFVVGGSTPAALAGDWIASLLDQNPGNWAASPLGTQAETVVLGWLKDLFGLPESYGGVLTTSATSANFTALSAARFWWAERHGVDVTADGLAGLPPMPVFSSGYVHVSTRKALQMLGLGRDTVRRFARDDAGRVDLTALDRALAEAGGPAVIVANAGDVNTGDFDPIDAMADLAERHGAWLHVDGAFGLFAAVSPRTRHLVGGIDRADSVISDGHKWLNVPYESGFAFVRDPALLGRAFGAWDAPYLPGEGDEHVNYQFLGPDSSRRARALPIWATLRAYGREGHRAMVERHLDLAAHLGRLVEEAPDLELLAPVGLCVVCFRYRRPGVADLDALNARLGAELLADGRVFAGTTVYRGMTALRPAIVNWRTTEADVELLVSIVREIGARLTG
ncbi:pyridoxal phosphate-dependent decarboxylase family protein [Actinoallomurus rhizosphaericola]|uniref:pyridoxal phosphate-dependent decarboxylase family protein n=1 Tax=Actinoallomurus rhizosphaericola TaxID=2952536 RepID=UPI002091A8FD|nr:aspartate aminotransferase family protein [Actinoallomurus rhizosphaericola]MCO5992284.1 aspartate aminotransferase family protein [Actinoallomurus rhizosphaericola]